jgi:hypothetical protein
MKAQRATAHCRPVCYQKQASLALTHSLLFVSGSDFLPGLHDPGDHSPLNSYYRTRSEQDINFSSNMDLKPVQLGRSESVWTSINLQKFRS